MANFELQTTTTSTKKVRRSPVALKCILCYPESLAEQVSHADKCALDSSSVLNFYVLPIHGDFIEHAGQVWEVSHLIHHPYKPYSRGTKKASEIVLDWKYTAPEYTVTVDSEPATEPEE